jgi:hypothetical protein
VAEQDEVYDQIAREAIEHALGRTFENPEAVPRRDAFIRDATDLLARFVAARCGNPGFHSARFFDAVIALSNARTRIRDAARRSRVVERLVEAERRVRTLEVALNDRNEQLVHASTGDVGTLARALADADARIRTLERDLSEARNAAAVAAPPESAGPKTERLARIDAEDFFNDTAEKFEAAASETKEMTYPGALKLDEPIRAARLAPEDGIDPEKRIAALKAELEARQKAESAVRTEKEQLELERDALNAQMRQLADREKPLRDAKAAIGRERDDALMKIQELEKELHALEESHEDVLARVRADRTAIERERDDALRGRAAAGELKKSLEQELVLANQERDAARGELAEKDAARARAEARAEKADELRKQAEALAARESTLGARARRDRDEVRAERDRIKGQIAELVAVKARHEALLTALEQEKDAPLEVVLAKTATRHELVLAHEPPEWDLVLERVQGLAARGNGVSLAATAWAERVRAARARYEVLVGKALEGEGSAAGILELACIVTAHEDDRRSLDLIEALVPSA